MDLLTELVSYVDNVWMALSTPTTHSVSDVAQLAAQVFLLPTTIFFLTVTTVRFRAPPSIFNYIDMFSSVK